MSAANENWARWVYASIAAHLRAKAQQNSVALYIEQIDTQTLAYKASTHKAEATIYGPHTRELSKDVHSIEVEIFITFSTEKQRQTNKFDHVQKSGVMQNALDQCIEIKAYEIGEDAPETVGYLTPKRDESSAITLNHLKPGDSDPLLHSVLTAKYDALFSQ